ncbi:MAG: sulfurtransferase complex subunit TusB [Methylovulum sp.]|jgi:tRNA 2-thiouridine synthesizing protein B|nr:MAG: sulfurtransferase complex subunit TusB [Methylovulum sp.]
MLHLIFQSPLEVAVLGRISAGDDVVFLESAVLGLLQMGNLAGVLTDLTARCRLYVLSDAINARGILADELVAGMELIDYAGLVALTVKNPAIQSWS